MKILYIVWAIFVCWLVIGADRRGSYLLNPEGMIGGGGGSGGGSGGGYYGGYGGRGWGYGTSGGGGGFGGGGHK